eukprot:363767-Chlamydomonas_euryale.AAC.1
MAGLSTHVAADYRPVQVCGVVGGMGRLYDGCCTAAQIFFVCFTRVHGRGKGWDGRAEGDGLDGGMDEGDVDWRSHGLTARCSGQGMQSCRGVGGCVDRCVGDALMLALPGVCSFVASGMRMGARGAADMRCLLWAGAAAWPDRRVSTEDALQALQREAAKQAAPASAAAAAQDEDDLSEFYRLKVAAATRQQEIDELSTATSSGDDGGSDGGGAGAGAGMRAQAAKRPRGGGGGGLAGGSGAAATDLLAGPLNAAEAPPAPSPKASGVAKPSAPPPKPIFKVIAKPKPAPVPEPASQVKHEAPGGAGADEDSGGGGGLGLLGAYGSSGSGSD